MLLCYAFHGVYTYILQFLYEASDLPLMDITNVRLRLLRINTPPEEIDFGDMLQHYAIYNFEVLGNCSCTQMVVQNVMNIIIIIMSLYPWHVTLCTTTAHPLGLGLCVWRGNPCNYHSSCSIMWPSRSGWSSLQFLFDWLLQLLWFHWLSALQL